MSADRGAGQSGMTQAQLWKHWNTGRRPGGKTTDAPTSPVVLPRAVVDMLCNGARIYATSRELSGTDDEAVHLMREAVNYVTSLLESGDVLLALGKEQGPASRNR